jgi:hypothetical protein
VKSKCEEQPCGKGYQQPTESSDIWSVALVSGILISRGELIIQAPSLQSALRREALGEDSGQSDKS